MFCLLLTWARSIVLRSITHTHTHTLKISICPIVNIRHSYRLTLFSHDSKSCYQECASATEIVQQQMIWDDNRKTTRDRGGSENSVWVFCTFSYSAGPGMNFPPQEPVASIDVFVIFLCDVKWVPTAPLDIHFIIQMISKKSKVKQSLYTPWRRLGGDEV
jgi:hypothetical protein